MTEDEEPTSGFDERPAGQRPERASEADGKATRGEDGGITDDRTQTAPEQVGVRAAPVSGADAGSRFPDAPGPGALVGDCRIVEKLGEGGMGVVYQAVRRVLKRTVALKVLPPSIRTWMPGCGERFVREAQSAARLEHPHAVTVYNAGDDEGLAYIEMEYVVGSPLAEAIREGPLKEAEAARIGAAVARVLGVAHEEGIIHRDIKPGNVMLRRDGEPKVSDFGLAGPTRGADHAAADAEDGAAATAPDGDERITSPGVVLGTLGYMAPEQLAGEAVDGRADLYALGVTLYHALTGEIPFGPERTAETEVPDVRAKRPDVSDRMREAIRVATARDADERHEDGEELAAALAPADGPMGDADGGDASAFWQSFSRMLRGVRPADQRGGRR